MGMVCPKCLQEDYALDGKDINYCQGCGTKLVEWDLKCACGMPIPPALYSTLEETLLHFFTLGILGKKTTRATPLFKYCRHCGTNTVEAVKAHIDKIRI